MTRGEACQLAIKWQNMHIITAIYAVHNDYESRTCENCKHMHYWTETDIAECSANEPQLNWETMEPLDFFEVTFDFGCNKWQQKD